MQLTNEQLMEIIRYAYVEKMSSRKIQAVTGISKSAVNRFLSRKTYKEFWETYDEKPHAGVNIDPPEQRRSTLPKGRYVFTSAQNNSYVHLGFLNSLKHFLKQKDAELIVGTNLYNKNGYQNLGKDPSIQEDERVWFDPHIKDYIKDEQSQVADNLLWLGELNMSPTKVNPFSGFYNYTKLESGIIPHNKVNLESLPVHKKDPAKFLYTTGSITRPNFIQKIAGQKAEWHHIIGALYVEVDEDGDWFARQLQAESSTGNFYDLEYYYTPNGIENHIGKSVEAINWGDLHFEKIDKQVAENAFGVKVHNNPMMTTFSKIENNGNMLDTLRPRYQFCHDTADFTTRNHHNIKDPHFRFEMFAKNYDSVRNSLTECSNGLNAMCRDFSETVVVQSNHDVALERWLKSADYRLDPPNAVFFLERQLAAYKAIESGDTDYNIFGDTMTTLTPQLKDQKITFLGTDESFRLFDEHTGIECGYHGDLGINGSRGTANAYTKIGIRVNIGHSHSAKIKDGVYQAGVSGLLDMGYNKGASSWSHSHIITYRNGKRCIVTMKNGKWRA
ncbi:MAG: hypothetical protein CL489_08940 [Acidobacteria bacterium]|nr:hypothetical protein [Acidobacteriota bacterium]|tara:strand:- start:38812 stop:40485 length:1674 start_codon:yes stop_codon:yes gene_type:complete